MDLLELLASLVLPDSLELLVLLAFLVPLALQAVQETPDLLVSRELLASQDSLDRVGNQEQWAGLETLVSQVSQVEQDVLGPLVQLVQKDSLDCLEVQVPVEQEDHQVQMAHWVHRDCKVQLGLLAMLGQLEIVDLTVALDRLAFAVQ